MPNPLYIPEPEGGWPKVDWEKEAARMPIMVRDDTVSKALLRERLETKAEEFKEGHEPDEYMTWLDGLIEGLYMAVSILEES